MREKILNEDVVSFAKELRDKGYSQKKICEFVKQKFSLKSCSLVTIKRALKKKV